MTKGKRRATAAELASDGSKESQEFAGELTDQMSRRTVVRHLARLRNRHSVNQEQIASDLECNQSRISKLENGFDIDLTVRDLTAYAKAAKCDLGIVFKSRNLSIADEAKYLARDINRRLARLSEIAKNDSEIAKGVAKFHVSALIELVSMVADSAKELGIARKRLAGSPRVFVQVDEPDGSDEPGLTGGISKKKKKEPLSVS